MCGRTCVGASWGLVLCHLPLIITRLVGVRRCQGLIFVVEHHCGVQSEDGNMCFQVGYVICVLLAGTYKQKRQGNKSRERVNSVHSPIPLLNREVKGSKQYSQLYQYIGTCRVGCK